MKKMRILHLARLVISKFDRKKIDEHELAFLCTMAFAVDEISILQKLYMQSIAVRPKDDELLLLSAIQENTIARVLSAKLYEAIGLLEKYTKVAQRAKAADIISFLAPHQANVIALKAKQGYGFAGIVRNKVTSHYIPSETEKNLEHVSDRAAFFAILEQRRGNSFYPFGEEVVFIGRINRYCKEVYGRPVSLADLEDWHNWNIEVSAWLSDMFYQYMLWRHQTKFPEWRLRHWKPYLETELHSEIGEAVLPLFFSDEQYRERMKGQDSP